MKRIAITMMLVLAAVAVRAQREADTARVERITFVPHLVTGYSDEYSRTANCEDFPQRIDVKPFIIYGCRFVNRVDEDDCTLRVPLIWCRMPGLPPSTLERYLDVYTLGLLPPMVEVQEVDGQKVIIPGPQAD